MDKLRPALENWDKPDLDNAVVNNCKHPGCREGLHITHPCEKCGRIYKKVSQVK